MRDEAATLPRESLAFDGWRLPARELERTVAAAAQQLLTDEPAIATAVEEAGVAANRIT